MSKNLSSLELDKSKLTITSVDDRKSDAEYWWRKSPQERLIHLERLRRINYGYHAGERLQRIFEVAELQ